MVDYEESEHGPALTGPAPDHTAIVGGDPDMATAKSTKSPAFQFYPKDFLSSSKVRKMSLTEIGAYTVLLATSWLDGSLPTDLAELARTLGIKDAQFRRMWAGPLGQCFYEKNGRLFNDRLEEERKKQAEFRRRQSDNGRMGGRPKGLGSSGLTQTEPKKSSSSSSAFASAIASAEEEKICAEPQSDSPPVLTFPTTGSGGKTWTLTEAQVTKWASAYPHLDVLSECRRALAWVEANQRKTAKGMPAFLIRWFNKAVDRGPARKAEPVDALSTWAERRALRDAQKAVGQ